MATTIEMDGSSQQATAFTSIMPILDDLLDLIGRQATADEIGGGSNDDVVKKAKELRSRMEEMKKAAIELPGGHISLDQAVELEAMLDLETEKRRSLLRAFADSKMDTVDRMEISSDGGLGMPAANGNNAA